MTIPANQALRISYRSCAIAFAAAKTKHDIANARRNKLRAEIAQNVEDGVETKRKRQRLYNGWRNLCVALDHAMKLYSTGRFGPETSLKIRLENLWVDRGLNLSNLPDYDTLSQLGLARLTTFDTDVPTNTNFNDWAAAFTDNTGTLFNATDPPRKQFIDVFDTAVEDLWREEAWRRWVRKEMNENQLTPSQLAEWDDIITKTRDYFVLSNRCMYTIADIMDLHDDEASNNHPARVDQYRWKPTGPAKNSLEALGGLFAANRPNLPTTPINFRNQVEVFDVLFE